jgi:hypothetical protein
MIGPGVMMRSRTPRCMAATSAPTVRSSGTKYALDRSMVLVAAAIDSRYIRCMLSLPPEGELLNTWARPPPTACESAESSARRAARRPTP